MPQLLGKNRQFTDSELINGSLRALALHLADNPRLLLRRVPPVGNSRVILGQERPDILVLDFKCQP